MQDKNLDIPFGWWYVKAYLSNEPYVLFDAWEKQYRNHPNYWDVVQLCWDGEPDLVDLAEVFYKWSFKPTLSYKVFDLACKLVFNPLCTLTYRFGCWRYDVATAVKQFLDYDHDL